MTLDVDVRTDRLPVYGLHLLREVCAYCGTFNVRYVVWRPDLVGGCFCCDEPTHWAWLVESVAAIEEEPT